MAIAGAAAQAQESAGGLQEIIVTAEKRSEKITDVGMSIDALSGDKLAELGIQSPADLVKVVPGFNYTRGAYGAPVFTLRGVGYSDTSLAAAPAVTVYVDEAPLPFSIMAAGVGLDAERVEVLKGPQGTLFGQNSTGGAVNYIAAKPTKDWQAGISTTIGNYGTVNPEGYISGPISDTLRFRIAAREDHSDDWQKSYTRPDETTGSTDRATGRLLVDWDATDALTVHLNVNGWRDRSDPQAVQFIGVYSGAKAPASVARYPVSPDNDRAADWQPGQDYYIRNDFFQTALREDYAVSDSVTLTSISSYEKTWVDNESDLSGTSIQNFNPRNWGTIDSFSQELRGAGDLEGFGRADFIHWTLGGNYQNDHVIDNFEPFAAVSSFPFKTADAHGDNKVATQSAFGDVDVRVTDTITLQEGIRYSDQHRHYAGCTYDTGDGSLAAVIGAASSAKTHTAVVVPPGGCATLGANFLPGAFRDDLNENNVSWRTGANWKITPDALLYANVSRGYKNGNFVTTGSSFIGSLAPAKQETVLAYEAGLKLKVSDSLQLTGAVYYDDYGDKQVRGRVNDPTFGLLNKLLNVPKSRIEGAELQATWQTPLPGLRITAGGNYSGSKILDTFNSADVYGTIRPLAGESLPFTPDWQFDGDAEYDFVLGSMNLFVGADATYQSATNAALGADALTKINDYSIVDLRAGIYADDDSWRVTAYIHNLADTYYWSNVFVGGPDTAARLTGMPLTFGATLSYKFR